MNEDIEEIFNDKLLLRYSNERYPGMIHTKESLANIEKTYGYAKHKTTIEILLLMGEIKKEVLKKVENFLCYFKM